MKILDDGGVIVSPPLGETSEAAGLTPGAAPPGKPENVVFYAPTSAA